MMKDKRSREDKFLLLISAILLLFVLVYHTCAKADNSYDREKIIEEIRVEAQRQGVDPDVAIAVATVESGLNPTAIGKKGEIGLFQLMPYQGRNLWDMNTNIRTGIKILNHYKQLCEKDMHQSWVVCYNQGSHRRPKYPQLHPYYKRVARVLAAMK